MAEKTLVTTIPKLDKMLGGGIKPYNSVLLYAHPGVKNNEFAMQILHSNLSQGGKGIYFINNKFPDIVNSELERFDWSVDKYKKKFAFVDGYSNIVSQPSDAEFVVSDYSNIKQIDKSVVAAIKKYKNKNTVLVFDSLSSLFDIYANDVEILEYVTKWLKLSKRNNTTPVFLFTEWPYSKTLLRKIKSLFDCIINIKAIEDRIILREYFSVGKVKWLKSVKRKGVPFKVVAPGGIKVYIPKLLVTGPFNAGKTSFVHSASISAVSVDRLGTTVALDHGHVQYSGFKVDLFGTPGQQRFDPVIKLLGGEAFGVVVVVDSTDPDSFTRAKEMLIVSHTNGLPTVIAANKANLVGALKPEQIRVKMKLSKKIPIIPIRAKNSADCQKSMPIDLNEDDIHSVFNAIFEVII